MTTKPRTIIAAVFALLLLTAPAFADEYVNGYTRSDGTYVQGYYRSSPDGTVTNNYSYEGNVNPYTGAVGTNRYEHDEASPYFTGPDGQGRIGHSDSERNDNDDQ
jgi:hypothetical protein